MRRRQRRSSPRHRNTRRREILGRHNGGDRMPSDVMGRGWADVLAEIPLFAGLSKRHLNKIAGLAKTRRYARFTSIVREGERGDSFYVILDGTVLVKPSGKRTVRLKAGDWFGEMAL